MRNALARALYDAARVDPRVVVIVADISPAGAMDDFRCEFPERFINVGVAEQSMIGLAAGMAQRGFRPFCYTIATFALFRTYEFIRCDLAYQNLPVTVVGMGAGLSYSTLGGTHQAIEDVAVAMACPGLTMLAPCDAAETAECARWCAERTGGGPVYLRIGKSGEPNLTGSSLGAWELGQVRWVDPSPPPVGDVCVLSYGPIAAVAIESCLRLRDRQLGGLVAAAALVPTLSPLPESDIARILSRWRNVVVVEEASGAPLAREVMRLARGSPANVYSHSLPSAFPHIAATRGELLELSGLTASTICSQFC